jgi:hypothetical protein
MSVIHNLSWEDYQQVKRMNPSTLVAGLKSMLKLKRAIAGGMYEESNAMRIGTGIHALLLEPDEFESRFVVMPDFHLHEENVTKDGKRSSSTATTYYKEKVAEFVKQASGKSVLTRSEYDQCLMCIESLHSRPAISKLITESSHEVTVYGEIEGVEFKGRIDALTTDCIVDLKTTADVSPLVFGRRFFSLGYDFKLAIYRELVRQNMEGVNDVKVIAQEPSGDFDNCLHPIYPEILDMAFQRVLGVVRQYKECLATNVWPGVDGGQDEIDLWVPSYVIDDSIHFSDSPEEAAAAQEFVSPF